jgi:hypothetical protein
VHWTDRSVPYFLRWHDLAHAHVAPEGDHVILERPDGTRHVVPIRDEASRLVAAVREEHRTWCSGDSLPPTPVRTPPVTEELVRIAIDPRSPPDERIGAALVLSQGDRSHRAAVRRAAEVVADHDLHIALGDAIEGRINVPFVARAVSRPRSRY